MFQVSFFYSHSLKLSKKVRQIQMKLCIFHMHLLLLGLKVLYLKLITNNILHLFGALQL